MAKKWIQALKGKMKDKDDIGMGNEEVLPPNKINSKTKKKALAKVFAKFGNK